MPLLQIPLVKIAANAECIEGVDMARVYHYRKMLRAFRPFQPIVLLAKNKQDYYYLDDGNHRTLALLIEGKRFATALVDQDRPSPSLSWRWPRVAPVMMTLNLMKLEGLVP